MHCCFRTGLPRGERMCLLTEEEKEEEKASLLLDVVLYRQCLETNRNLQRRLHQLFNQLLLCLAIMHLCIFKPMQQKNFYFKVPSLPLSLSVLSLLILLFTHTTHTQLLHISHTTLHTSHPPHSTYLSWTERFPWERLEESNPDPAGLRH